ncbi:hypothetical protein [Nocardioides sp.]|uniref:hypothetical protein n=1 Tax=Nocardioides sp. TaxID=35761 RepID=UPI0026323FAB|nr:hypothetical protein [Nocardioides sp.]MCW2737635.1 hypothetical protein [Nocardioides sp.]
MDPRRLLPVLTALACACVVATLVVALARPGGRSPGATPAPERAGEGPVGILAAWDRRRAEAWATGDVGALRSLYAVGSRTGAADARLLRDYRRRGLTVEGLTTQVLALDVVERSSTRLVLVVTDRVVGGEALGAASPVALPADRASTRRIVLVRVAGKWRVAEARYQASAAASTSRTSSSSKS